VSGLAGSSGSAAFDPLVAGLTPARPTKFSFDTSIGRYDGSIECFSAERHTFRKKQSLKPLPLLQRRLYPEIRGTRQNSLRKVQDALDVELLDLGTVAVKRDQGQFFAQSVALPFVRAKVNGLLTHQRVIEAVKLLLVQRSPEPLAF
jgi:hypothetical protein